MGETMRERLERLKGTSSRDFESRKEEQFFSSEKKLLTPETIYMKKVDTVIATIEFLRTKMHSGTDQYLSLYHELKKAEADFIALLDDPENKFMDLPGIFINRVENTKKILLTKKF